MRDGVQHGQRKTLKTRYTQWKCCNWGIILVSAVLLIVYPHCTVIACQGTCNRDIESTTLPTIADETSLMDCSDDDDAICQLRASLDDCETEPSWMLLHCRKSCAVCLSPDDRSNFDGAVEQNPGFGQVPHEISLKILKSIRRSNIYLRDEIGTEEEYALIRDSGECHDEKELCAFWETEGQCSDDEYSEYMAAQCPLSCRICGSDVRRGRAFLRFLGAVLTTAYRTREDGGIRERDVVADRHRTLSLLMSRIGMDPQLLGRPLTAEDGNWVKALHRKVTALVPPVLLGLYGPEGPIDDEEFTLLTSLHNFSGVTDRTTLLNNILVPYRERGYIVSIMRDFDHLITRPIQLGIGFSVPNEAALDRIKRLGSPILQIGAGAGYWAAILKHRGVDVLAYDVDPPCGTEDPHKIGVRQNAFFDVVYTNNIMQGACTDIFYGRSGAELAKTHSLLIIWPNDPDPVDNTHFCIGNTDCVGSQPVWDSDCLSSYIKAGGSQVIYVGEREESIDLLHSGSSPDCGISSTRAFQKMLTDNFSLEDTVKIPRWWLNNDDLTIWDRT